MLVGRLWRAALVDPEMQLVAVEKIIAAIDQRGRGAILEVEERDGAAFGRPRRIEPRGLGAHAAQPPSPDQPHHVDLMRHLVEQDATAACRIELFRPPRPVEEIRVIPRRDHAEPAEFAARHDAPHFAHRWIEGVCMTDDEVNFRALDCRNDGVAIGKRQRHRLFENNVFAGAGSERGMGSVELMRRRDVDDVDGRVRGKLGYIRIGARIEVACEGFTRCVMRIGCGNDFHAGMSGRGAHHNRTGHAEARNGNAKRRARRFCHQAGSPAASLSRSTRMSSPCSTTL